MKLKRSNLARLYEGINENSKVGKTKNKSYLESNPWIKLTVKVVRSILRMQLILLQLELFGVSVLIFVFNL